MSAGATAYKLETALSMVETLFPNAVHVLAAMDVRLDDRVKTAAVTPSGRMLVAPAFLDALTVQQTVFVIAHELYHVLYGVFDRFDSDTPSDRRWLVNIAHDFIINDMLERKFREAEFYNARNGKSVEVADASSQSEYIPREGLFWADYAESYKRIVGEDQPPLETFSLESLVFELERIRNVLPAGNPLNRMVGAEKAADSPLGSALGDLLDQLGAKGVDDADSSDTEKDSRPDDGVDGAGDQHDFSDILGGQPELLTEREESDLFPGETVIERKARTEKIRELKELSSARDALCRQMDAGRGFEPGGGDAIVHAQDGTWNTPWERALQKWFDDNEPPARSWAKASRRAGDRSDVVLPGRVSEGCILNVVVDTSGSMECVLPAVFGMIQSFGKTSGVRVVRIIQCDVEVTGDDLVDIDDLAAFQVKGFGGSDMSPGLLRLADDPTVEAALVLTDGWIDYPQKEAIPFEVLWCVIGDSYDVSRFSPGYGSVISIPIEHILSYGRSVP